MSASQWLILLVSALTSFSAAVFYGAVIFQGRKEGHNQYKTKLLMPPLPQVSKVPVRDAHTVPNSLRA